MTVAPLPSSRRVLGRYAIYDEIASGGMATVHVGRLVGPVGFARTVAIKCLHPQLARDPEFVSMFVDEARLAARVAHPNVVATLDVVSDGGELFLVMEYVAGESVASLVRRAPDGRVPPPIAVAVAMGALHGLHAAHEALGERGEQLHIVHRDVSPQNVLVGIDGVARVLDFGIAMAASRVQVTRQGQVKGKLGYMAPEQLEGHNVDRRSDVYGAGVVLWEALTGQRLFAARDGSPVLTGELRQAPPAPSARADGVPPALDGIVLRALAFGKGARFASAKEMAIALEETGLAASQREVGEWVERTALESLRERSGVVAALDAGDRAARAEDPTRALGRVRGASTADGATSGVVRRRTPARRRAVGVAIGVASLVGLVVYAAVHAALGPKGGAGTAVEVSSERGAEVPVVVHGGPPSVGSAGVASPVDTVPGASTSAASEGAASGPGSRGAPARNVAAARPHARASGCDPPFTIDSEGVRVPKRHCL